MKFLVVDANLLIAFLDKNDALHRKATEVVTHILSLARPHKIVIPRVCIAEIVVVLRAKGLDAFNVEDALRRFIDQPYVVVLDVSEMQIHKFASPVQKRVEGKKVIRTSDYLVGVLARVLDGKVLTFDKGFSDICPFCDCLLLDSSSSINEKKFL
jgi:predicted nucleic acid-binding protein